MKSDDISNFDSSKFRKEQEAVKEIMSIDKVNINEIITEENKVLRTIWNDLGVTELYRFIFESIINDLSHKERSYFLEIEIASLEKICDDLMKLSKEIKTREKILILLRSFEEILIDSEINSKLANDILFSFKNLREISMKIVKLFKNLREFNHYNNYKFDHEKINNKRFFFERNYLIKMRSDLNFLKDGSLARYFHLSRHSDPFLLSLSENFEAGTKVSEDQMLNKFYLPISNEMSQIIKEYQHDMITDIILYEISLRNKSTNSKLGGHVLSFKKNVEEIKNIKSPNIGHDSRQAVQSIQNEINKKLSNTDNNALMKINNHYINLEKEITMLKKDYEDNNENKLKEDFTITKENFSNANYFQKKTNSEITEVSKESPEMSKSHKNHKNNLPKIKIVIEEKDVLKEDLNSNSYLESDKHSNKQKKEISNQQHTISINIDGFDFIYVDSVDSNEYQNHLKEVPQRQKTIFKIQENLNNCIGVFPKFLRIYKDKQLISYLSYYYDFTSQSSLKIVLNHISTNISDDNELENFLLTIKNFLVQRIMFDEVYISLHHYTDKDNNFIIDKEIAEIFKKKLLFRWYKLLNTGNNERITILWFKNEGNIDPAMNQRYLNESMYVLRLKCAITYKIKKTINKSENSNYSGLNIFPLAISLARLETDVEAQGYHLKKFGSIDKDTLKKTRCNFVSSIIEQRERLLENLSYNGVDIQLKEAKQHNKLSSGLMIMKLKFENITSSIIKLEGKEYFYNLLTVKKIDMLINKENSQVFYLIPIDDNNTMMLSEISSFNIKDNICEDFYKTYSKLEPVEKGESKTKILLPCFNKLTKNFYRSINIFKELMISKKGNQGTVQDINEYNEITFNHDIEYNKSIKLIDYKDCLIFKEDFLFGIINYDILEETNIPAVYLNYIEKGNWKQV